MGFPPAIIATTEATMNTSQNSFTVSVPGTPVFGDLLVIGIRGQTNAGVTAHWSHTGWTLVSTEYALPDANRRVSDILVFPVTDPDAMDASIAWTEPSGFGGNRACAEMHLIRGVDLSKGTQGVIAGGTHVTSTTYTGHDVTDGIDSLTLLWAMAEFATPQDHAAGATPSGWTELNAVVEPTSGDTGVSRTALRSVYATDMDPVSSTALPFVGTATAPVTVGITLRGFSTRLFRPPTYPMPFPRKPPSVEQFNRYWTYDQGSAVVVSDDTATTVQFPYQGDLEAYDRVYLGGYDHQIDSEEADFLTSQGYGEFIT